MAFGNTVRARVDLDISPFRRGLLSAQSELGKFSSKLSTGKVLTSILSGLGLGSGFMIAQTLSQKIADAIAGGSKEGWERAQASSEAYALKVEARLLKMKTPGQQAEYWRTEAANAEKEASRPQVQFPTSIGGRNLGFRVAWGLFSRVSNRFGLNGAETEEEAQNRQTKARDKALTATNSADAQSQAQRDLNAAIRDELEQRRLIGKTEDEQYRSLGARAKQLEDEADLLKKTDAPAAAQKRLQAERLISDQHRIVNAAQQSYLKTQEVLDNMSEEQAAQMETSTEKINRLRGDAVKLQKKIFDTTYTLPERQAYIIQAQQKINQALSIELSLRKSNLSVADIAAKGGDSTRGREARRAQRLREQADKAAAEGRFGTAERYRGQAQGIEDKLAKQERDYLEGKDQPPQSEWDKKYGSQLKKRVDDMDKGIQQRRDDMEGGLAMTRDRAAHGGTRLDQIRASMAANKEDTAKTLTDALDASTLLKKIVDALTPTNL